MSERISVIRGRKPIIFVATHAPEELYTGEIAKYAATCCEGSAIVNNGFRRSQVVDVLNNKANCNNIDHAQAPVVKDEFLDPLCNIVRRHCNLGREVQIYYIHGCSDAVHQEAKDEVGCIIGYGDTSWGTALTCDSWKVALFASIFNSHGIGKAYRGRPGGRFSADSPQNVVQYFNLHLVTERQNVICMQLEIPKSFRKGQAHVDVMGTALWKCSQLVHEADSSVSYAYPICEVPTI